MQPNKHIDRATILISRYLSERDTDVIRKHVKMAVDAALKDANAELERLQGEKERREFYQGLVYDAMCFIDKALNRSEGIGCTNDTFIEDLREAIS